MAYIPNQEDENEKNAAQPQAASGGPVLSAESGTIGGSSSGAPAAGSPGGAKPAGSGFVNLNKYITANEGNDAAMGGAVDNTVGKVASDADTKGTGFSTKAASTVQSNIIKDTNNTTGAVKNLADGNPWTIDDNEFGKLYNAEYKGPKTARDAAAPEYDSASSAYDKTTGYAGLAKDNAGRKTLLADTYAGPKAYNSGEKSLDSFILGGGKKGAESLQGIQNKWGDYTNKFKGLAGTIDSGITDAVKTTDDTRNTFRGAVGATKGALEGDVEGAVTKATTANTEAANVNAGFTPEEIAIANSHGLDPASFVARGGNFGAKDFLGGKADSYEKLRALLGGVDPASQFKFGTDVVTKGGGKASVVDTNRVAGVKALTGVETGLKNKLTTAQAAKNDQVNAALGNVKNFNFLKNQLGISDEDLGMVANEINGLDANQFVDRGADLSLSSVATPEEIAAYNSALEQAAGANRTIKKLSPAEQAANVRVKDIQLKQMLEGLLAPKKEAKRAQEAAAKAAAEKAAEEKRIAEAQAREDARLQRLIDENNAISRGNPNNTRDPVKQGLENPADALKNSMVGGGDAIAGAIQGAGDALTGAVQPVLDDGANKLSTGWTNAKSGNVKW